MKKLLSAFVLAVTFLAGWTALLRAQTPQQIASSHPAAVDDAESYEVVGHIGGRAQAIAVQGQYVYVGFHHEFAVLDASDSQHLRRIGYVAVPFGIRQIELAGNRAYLFSPGYEVKIIDVTNPTGPQEVGALMGVPAIRDVKARDNMVYVLASDQLRIFDVADPTNPSELGHYQLPQVSQAINHFAISGTYAYLAAWEAGVRVIDVSNPASPSEVGHSEPMWASDLAIAEGYAYVLSRDLRILSLANPIQPTQIGVALGGCQYCDPFYIRAINHTAYVWWSHTSDVSIVDAQHPAQPVVIGQITQPQSIYDLAAQGSTVFVADDYAGVRVINVASPAQPQEVSHFRVVPNSRALAIRGSYAYVADDSGLYAIDVTSPTFPVQVGYSAAAVMASDMVVEGQIAYIATLAQGFHSIDVSDPANPIELGTVSGLTGSVSVAITGSYAYVTAGYAGMAIIDISDPTSPTLITTFSAPDPDFKDIAIMGSYAYLSDFWNGLRVVDISNPMQPILIGSIPISGVIVGSVAAADGYVYVTSSYGLTTVDVRIPNTPQVVGWSPQVPLGDITVVDGIAYLAADGVYAYDVRNPAQPVEIGHIQLAASASDVAVSGDIIYVGETNGGLDLLRFSGTLLGRVLTPNVVPVPGIKVALNGTGPVTTDSRGVYSFTNLLDGAYTITAMSSGYVFAPALRSITLPNPLALPQDFIALPQPLSATLDSSLEYTLTLTDPLGMPTSIYIPLGSVTRTIELFITPTVQSLSLPSLYFTGHAYDLAVSVDNAHQSDWAFIAPLTMTISYHDASVAVISDKSALVLLRWNQDHWEDALLSCPIGAGYGRDTAHNLLQIPVCRSGRFALYGPTHRWLIPMISLVR